MGMACGHIKAFGLLPFPHQRKSCAEGLVEPICLKYAGENTGVVEESDEDMLFWKDSDPDDQPTISDQLDSEQQQQLSQLPTEFGQVLQNQPDHTQLAEHRLTRDQPILSGYPPTDYHKTIVQIFIRSCRRCWHRISSSNQPANGRPPKYWSRSRTIVCGFV